MFNNFCVLLRDGKPSHIIEKSSVEYFKNQNANYSFDDIENHITASDTLGQIEQVMTLCKQYGEVYKDGNRICIEVERGDWKHDHMYIKDIMSGCFNATCVEEKVTESGVDDSYSSIHYYELNEN